MAHDNWKLHKRIINFCQITNHSGDAVGRLLEKCLREWEIEKVFSITLDNASSNDGVVRYMKKKLKSWDSLVLDGEFLHMRCCAHITILIVCDGLVELHSSLKNIHRACKYTRSSPSRLERFRQCLLLEKIESKGLLPLECKMRWNSTYFLLEVAIKVKRAFERLVEEDPDFVEYCAKKEVGDECGNLKKKRKRFDGGDDMVKVEVSFPSIVDWCYAEAFVQFLERFYEATLKFSCYKKVTANAPFQEMINIASGLDATMTSDDLFMRRVTQSKKLKFDKYWGNSKEMNKLIFVAIILDPRYKLDYLTFGLDLLHKDAKEIEELTRDVRTILMRLYESYTPNNLDVGQTNSNVMVEESEGGIDGRKNPALFAYVNKMKDKHVVFISNEIDKYLGELAQDPMNLTFDLLMWWKENSSRFPILSKVAKDIFAVSVSSVASEAAFSAGKRVVDPFHACLTTKTVEALIFTNDWLKGEAFNYFKAPSDDDIDFFKNLENVEKEISMIAENIMDVG